MAKSQVICQLSLCCVVLSLDARGAAEVAPPTGTLPDLQRVVVSASESAAGRFRLELPVIGKPMLVTWQVGSAPTYDLLRWSTYQWETQLVGRGPLRLMAYNHVVPAADLNCLGPTCEPMQKQHRGIDLRLSLGGRGVFPDNYLFIRRQSVTSRFGRFSGVKFGIAGVLDL